MRFVQRWLALAGFVAPLSLFAQTKVGPAHGTVIVVGGGGMGPEVYNAFIQAAGGPDALIIDVPTAGGDTVYTQNAPGTRGWKNAGAKNVYVLHTNDRKLADSDSFVAIIRKAGGIWFEGGRQFHLVDSYAGTKTEQAFNDVLARGGVIAGSSAGASILGDFLVRGAPSNNNFIMDDPSHEKGFAYLRGVGIDQHVVARERLADLADSIIPKYPKLLAISEDEGTAWVVRGDTATIIGRNKAFVYNADDRNDPGKPFITLYPGDRFNLATRKVMHRAADDAPFPISFIDELFKKYSNPAAGGATVLVAQNGAVYVAKSYGIPDQPKYMPTTTVPQFALGAVADVFPAFCEQLPPAPAGRGGRGGRGPTGPPPTPLQSCLTRLGGPVGWHKTAATSERVVSSSVDELYRYALGQENPQTARVDSVTTVDPYRGWIKDASHGVTRYAVYGTADGKRNAFVRIPDAHATIIVLTNDDNADAKAIADRISDRVLAGKKT